MRFDLCAATYDQHAAPQRAFAVRVSDFVRRESWEKTLELGAGTGALTQHLCEPAGEPVLATDASPAMVRLGRGRVPQAEWAELNAFTGTIPMAALQVSSGLLQWAPDPLAVLRRWGAALSPGGRMVQAMPCEPCLCEWRHLVPESPVQWRDQQAWVDVFRAAGLSVSRSELWIEQVRFPSALHLVRAWHGSGVTGQTRIGASRLRQAIREYDLRNCVPDGVVSTWAWLAIEARC